MMLVLLYFLMASGDLFLRKVVRAFPSLRDKIRAVEIGRTIEREIGRYFLTYSLINLCVGGIVAAAMHFLGMPNALLWGLMVAVLNFVPYLGPVISLTVISVVALLTFDDLQHAIWPPLTYLVIEAIQGNVVQTLAFGRSLSLNPVAIFVAILFWGWLWGAPGILLAVPIARERQGGLHLHRFAQADRGISRSASRERAVSSPGVEYRSSRVWTAADGSPTFPRP